MKTIFLFFLSFYQKLLSPFLHSLLGIQHGCRYPLTCSAYAREAIEKKGVVRGIMLAVTRLMRCHPFIKQYELA